MFKTGVIGRVLRMRPFLLTHGVSISFLATRAETSVRTISTTTVEKAKASNVEKIVVDKATFDKLHAENRMATDKLAEGIDGFSKALVQLEDLLKGRLAALEA